MFKRKVNSSPSPPSWSNNVKPKTAYIEFDCPIEDFFEEWEDGNDTEPIQEDYDNWAFGTAMGCFERYRYELDNHLKFK
jgi:hypothetical protein